MQYIHRSQRYLACTFVWYMWLQVVSRLCWNWSPSALKSSPTWRSIFTNVAVNMAEGITWNPRLKETEERGQCFKLNNVAKFHSHRYIIVCFIIANSRGLLRIYNPVSLFCCVGGKYFWNQHSLWVCLSLMRTSGVKQSFYEAQLAIIFLCFWQLLHHRFCGKVSNRIVPYAPLITVNRLTLERINALGYHRPRTTNLVWLWTSTGWSYWLFIISPHFSFKTS
jgi:hypothetical protein